MGTVDSPSRLRAFVSKPEYTGENRCYPCTAVNLAIAAAVSFAIGVVQPWLGAAAFLAAISAIYFRGYLVPGTPTLTKRYLPERVLGWFGKPADARGDHPGLGGDRDETGAIDIAATLTSAGILREDLVGDDLVIEPEFANDWIRLSRRYADADADDTLLAAFLTIDERDLEEHSLTFEWRGNAFVASLGTERLGRWESRSAFVADLAAAEILGRRWNDWHELPVGYQGELLGGLRLFLETCPRCDGEVSLDHQVVESCCRSYDVVAATCDACGDRLFEADVPGGKTARATSTA